MVQCLSSIPAMAASEKSFLLPSEWLKIIVSDLIKSFWPDIKHEDVKLRCDPSVFFLQ